VGNALVVVLYSSLAGTFAGKPLSVLREPSAQSVWGKNKSQQSALTLCMLLHCVLQYGLHCGLQCGL